MLKSLKEFALDWRLGVRRTRSRVFQVLGCSGIMSAFQVAKALVIFLGISSIPSANAGKPSGDTAARASSADVAEHIVHGLGSWTSTSATKGSTVTVSVPQANITWQDKFPKASISHAQSCWSAYTNWFASYPGYYASANISVSTTTFSQPSTYVQPASSTVWPSGSVSTYKLCDGTPRASYSPSTAHFDSSMITEVDVYSAVYPTPIPEQPCTMDQADCAVMYFGTNVNNLSDTNSDDNWALGRLQGQCGYPLDTDVPCLVQGGPVELLYFPISTTGGDPGGCNEGTTVTPAEEPAPVTTLGSTFHPGTVYVSFETLYAAYRSLSGPGGAAVQIGKGYSNEIFEFRSDEISTNCYASVFSVDGHHNPGYGPGTQLNFADLNYPPPATAYECQNQCQSVSYELGPGGVNVTTHTILPNPCETIFDNFNPLIAVPTKLKAMNPEWASCRFWNHRQANIVFDPPIALTEAAAVAKPTLPGGYTTASAAMPASTVGSLPSRTATALADNMPSTTSGPSPHSPQKIPSAQKSASASSSAEQPTAIAFTPVKSTDQSPSETASTSAEQVLVTGDVTFTAPAASTDGSPSEAASTSAQQVLVAGDVTITAVSIPGATTVIMVHGVPITAPGATKSVMVQDSTISVGGPAVVVNGAIVSMGTQGLVAIQGSTASSARSQSATKQPTAIVFTPIASTDISISGTTSTPAQQVLAANDVTITAVSIAGATNAIMVDDSTVSIGGPAVTVDGAIVSLGTEGLVAIPTSASSSSQVQSTTTGSSHSSQAKSSSPSTSTTSGTNSPRSGRSLLGLGTVALIIAMLLLLP